jgi:hypothetical protein
MGLRFRQIIQLIVCFAITSYCSSVLAATPASKISTQTGLKAPVSQTTAETFNQWTTNGPYGGEIRALAVDPKTTTTLYAGVLSGGIFKSNDSAASWRKLDLNLPASAYAIQINTIAVDPVNPSNIYAGLYWYGIVKSTDGGESWSQINTGLGEMNVRSIAVDPSHPDTLYAATDGGGMFKSDNGGGSWSPINTGLPILSAGCIVLKLGSPDTLYIGIWGEGVFKSTDGGTNWNPANSGLSNLDVVSLVIDPVTPTTIYAGTANGGVFKSTNDGGAWILVKTGQIRTLAIDTAEPSNLYAGMTDTDTNTNGIFKSSNGGETWDRIFDHRFQINAIAVDPASPATIYAGTGFIMGDGIHKSTDHGATWRLASTGLMGAWVQTLAVDPETSTLYSGTSSGAFKSLDGGESWQGMSVGQRGSFVRTIAIDPSDTTTLYAVAFDKGIYKSTDGGDSWVEANTGLASSLVIDPTTPTTLYAAFNEGVYKSIDGAAHWTLSNTGLPTGQSAVLAIDPVTPAILYAGTWNQGVYRSTDGGENWSQVNNGLTDISVSSLAVDPVTPSNLYAATGSGVFKSTDGGTAWSPMNEGLTDLLVNVITIDLSSPTTLYAGTYMKGVFKSTNGGATWRLLPAGIGNYFNINAIVVDPNNPETIFVGTGDPMLNRKNGGVYRLTQAPEVTATPASFDFGQTTITTVGSQTLTIENSGYEPLQVTGINVVELDPYVLSYGNVFAVAPGGPNPCGSLTPLIPEGESCTIVITFTPILADARSGFLNIVSTAVNSPDHYILFTGTGVLPRHSLTTNMVGSGTINNVSPPPAFTCSAPNCTESFDQGTVLTLRATPSSLFEFSGWSGDVCSGLGDCSLTLNADTAITATFTAFPLVRVTDSSTLKVRNVSLTENLKLERPVAVSLNGGLESDFATVNGYTYLQGFLMVGSGSLAVNYLIIK